MALHTGESHLHIPQSRTVEIFLPGALGDIRFTVSNWTGNSELRGLEGSDAYTVNLTGAGTGWVHVFDGGVTGTDTVTINGSPAADLFSITPVQTALLGERVDHTTDVELLTVNGGAGDDDFTVDLLALNRIAINGEVGTNSLTVVDNTNVSYGSVLDPAAGIVYRPISATSGEIQVGSGPGSSVLDFESINGTFAVNGDGDGSGDRDVLTVLAVSTAGMVSPLAERTSPDGRDTITASDTEVTINNAALGALRSVDLGDSSGGVTFQTVVVRAGNEAVPFGDTITATPSNRMNVFIDGMNPASGTPGDSLAVPVSGPRAITVTSDPGLGPPHVRIIQTSNGASVGYVHIEEVPGVGVVVTGTGPTVPAHVRVLDAASHMPRLELAPFGGFMGGVTVAAGDLNGDAIPDIVVGTAADSSHVKAYDGISGQELFSFLAFPGFTGGVSVAAGDVDGDGRGDIIVGAGQGGPGGHVKVFSGATGLEIRSFMAYGAGFLGGVTVAAGDVDGDGFVDIVTGSGVGAAPHVKVISGATGVELASFLPYGPGFLGGVNVAAGDLNGDFRADVIVGTGIGGPPHIAAFDLVHGATLASFMVSQPLWPYSSAIIPLENGMRVGVADMDGDGDMEILGAKGPGWRSCLWSFTMPSLAQLDYFFVYDPLFGGGTFIGGSH